MAKGDTRAGDGAAEEGEIRDEKTGDCGKRARRRKGDPRSSEDSESSGPEDKKGSTRRKRERESERDCKRRKREWESRRSSGSSKRKRGSRRRSGSGTESEEEDSFSSSSSGSETESDSVNRTGTESEVKSEGSEESVGDARRRRREKRRKEEKERRRKKEKERERRRREKEKERKRRKEKEKENKRKKKEKALGKTGAVTNNWGKYGIIREIDMWNKRPEFTAWLAEVKQVNLESLANWEEKQMFKEFMEDHNTATFPSKKYYDLDSYHRRKMSKQMRKGLKEAPKTERTVFDDEEQRRQELLKEREKIKMEQVEALKRSMQSGMAQAMKEQALLREEMQLQYKLGNFEAAAAIQRRLDPDVAM